MKIQPDQVAARELAERGVDSSVGVFGSHHVQIGKASPVRLDEIKSADVAFAGFKEVTQVQRGRAGVEQTSRDLLQALAAPGSLDAGKVLGLLKAGQTHLDRLTKLGALDPAQKQDQEGLWMFTKAVENLSNGQLAAVFQTFTSAEMDLLQTALVREGNINPAAKDARMAAARLFNLQALVLKEVSNRTSASVLEDLRAANPEDESLRDENLRLPERLSAEYGHSAGGEEGPAAPRRHGLTATNLGILVETASVSAAKRERAAETERGRLDARGLGGVGLKAMGDVLRSAELTVNMNHEYFFADTCIIEHPEKPLPNIWHLADMGLKPKGEAYNFKRDSVERTLFPEMRNHAVKADERPVYGAINYEQNPFGGAPTYGNVTVVLKPEVKKRATYTLHDTFLAARAKVTPEARETFFRLLDGVEAIPATLKTALRRADSPERRAFDAWLAKVEAEPGIRLANCFIPREIPHVISDHYPQATYGEAYAGAAEQSLLGLLVKCFGDPSATRPGMVTHDNLEALIPDMSDADGNALAMAAIEAEDGKHPPITIEGARYIEAQIQGPVIPERDIAEIRLSLRDFPGREAEITAKAQAYERRTGIKVVLMDLFLYDVDNGAAQEKVERFNQQHLDRAGAHKALDEILADVPKAVAAYLAANAESSNVSAIPAALRPAVVFSGPRLSRFLAEVLEKIEADFGKERSQSSGPDFVKGAFRDKLDNLLDRVAPLLAEVGRLDFESEEQRLAFVRLVCSTESVATVEDVRTLHERATAQAALMRELAAAEPPPSAGEVLARFAAMPADGAAAVDVSAGAVALLRGTNPPIPPHALQRVLDLLDSETLRGLTAQIDAVAGAEDLRGAPDAARAAELAGRIRAAAAAVADSLRTAWTPPRPAIVPLTVLGAGVRAAIRQVAPALADALDAAHPAHPPFPAPANPGALPRDKAGRKQFLLGLMEVYREKELNSERGRSVHGRGHIIRAYIYANVFCNMLKEQGIDVDRNAVILGIAGHDLGRGGLGSDRWEKVSARQTCEAVRQNYGADAAGEAWEKEVADSIVGVEIHPEGAKKRTVPVSPTLEAQVLQSADSLDIGRTGDFDQYYFDFLRDKNGTVSPEAQKIRDQLAKEANLLQRLTNPLCAFHSTVMKLVGDAVDADEDLATELQKQRKELDDHITEELIAQGENDDNEAFFDDYEKVIRDNPRMFPLLTKYYLDAD